MLKGIPCMILVLFLSRYTRKTTKCSTIRNDTKAIGYKKFLADIFIPNDAANFFHA